MGLNEIMEGDEEMRKDPVNVPSYLSSQTGKLGDILDNVPFPMSMI